MSLIIFSAIEETTPETFIPPVAIAEPTVGELTPHGEFRLTLAAALAVESEESPELKVPLQNISSEPDTSSAGEGRVGLSEFVSVPLSPVPGDLAVTPFGTAELELVAAEIIPTEIPKVQQEKSVTLPSSEHQEETSDSALLRKSTPFDGAPADSAETLAQADTRRLAGELRQVDPPPQLDTRRQVHARSRVEVPSQVETSSQLSAPPQVETVVAVATLVPVVDAAESESTIDPRESDPEYLRGSEAQEDAEALDRPVLENVSPTVSVPRLITPQVPELESVPGEVTTSSSDGLPAGPHRPATIDVATLTDDSSKRIQNPAPVVAHSLEPVSLREGDLPFSIRTESTDFSFPDRGIEPGNEPSPVADNQIASAGSPTAEAGTEPEAEPPRPIELSNEKAPQASNITPELQLASLTQPANGLIHDAQRVGSENNISVGPQTSIEQQATITPPSQATIRPAQADQDGLHTAESTNGVLKEVVAIQRNDVQIPRSARSRIAERQTVVEQSQTPVDFRRPSTSEIELPRSEVEVVAEESSFISSSSASSTIVAESDSAGPLGSLPTGVRQSSESATAPLESDTLRVSRVDPQPTQSSKIETSPSINVAELAAVRPQVGQAEVAAQMSEASGTELKSDVRSTLPILVAMRPKAGTPSAFEPERLQIRLDPPELGRVLVDVASTEEGMTARISAIDPAARIALAEELPFLKSALSEAGIENVDIDLSDDDSGFERHDADQQEDEAQGHIAELQTATVAAGRNNLPVSNAAVAVLASGRVDILA